jgi:hypothetical protein
MGDRPVRLEHQPDRSLAQLVRILPGRTHRRWSSLLPAPSCWLQGLHQTRSSSHPSGLQMVRQGWWLTGGTASSRPALDPRRAEPAPTAAARGGWFATPPYASQPGRRIAAPPRYTTHAARPVSTPVPWHRCPRRGAGHSPSRSRIATGRCGDRPLSLASVRTDRESTLSGLFPEPSLSMSASAWSLSARSRPTMRRRSSWSPLRRGDQPGGGSLRPRPAAATAGDVVAVAACQQDLVELERPAHQVKVALGVPDVLLANLRPNSSAATTVWVLFRGRGRAFRGRGRTG